MPVVIGTSGWQYRDWRGRFYPPKLPQRLWLEHHAAAFATTEVNNSFYRLPAREVFEQWRSRTPADYVVTVKASRYLSHVKRLKEPAEPVNRLMERVSALGDRLGAVLLQLPPNLQSDVEKLDATLACFPAGTRIAVEPRHDSWWNPDLRDVLTAREAALVWSDRDSRPIAPVWRTADWAYLRLHHGGGEAFWPYDERALREWVARLADTWDDDEDAYVYTNNDPGGAALRDAVTFARLVREHGRTATRAPDVSAVSGELYEPAPRRTA